MLVIIELLVSQNSVWETGFSIIASRPILIDYSQAGNPHAGTANLFTWML